MNRFLPLVLALAFSAMAVALTVFAFRANVRIQPFRISTGGLRHKLDEVIEEITERAEDDR